LSFKFEHVFINIYINLIALVLYIYHNYIQLSESGSGVGSGSGSGSVIELPSKTLNLELIDSIDSESALMEFSILVIAVCKDAMAPLIPLIDSLIVSVFSFRPEAVT
jgi:hypothetical protein